MFSNNFVRRTNSSKYNYGDNWTQVSHQVKKRDNYACQKCGRQFPANSTWLHVHHKIPLSQGGDSSPENLITLCRDCHAEEHPHMQRRKVYSGVSKRNYKPLRR